MSDWQDDRPTRVPGMSAREEILARLRTALDVPRRDQVTEPEDVPRTYQRADDKQETSTDPAKIRDVLAARIADYTATVHRTTPSGLARTLENALEGAGDVLTPAGVPESWLTGLGDRVRRDDATATPRDLDGVGAVLTGCHTAIALTGTVVLRADELSGRRPLTLVPDHHVVVIEADQVVLGVPKAVERMNTDPTAAWTLVSGPSATSDIELERVEGVHGPRRLQVVLVDPEPESEPEPEPAPAEDAAAPDEASPPTKETAS